jgi:Cu2+-exporting ATPase/Cu+-exporting ATPase
MKTKRFAVKGMHCASCAFVIRDSLRKTQGIEKVEVNYASETANVSYDEKTTDVEKMNTVIGSYGYSLNQKEDEHKHHLDPKIQEIHTLRQSVRIVFPLSLIIFLIMVWNSFAEVVKIPLFPIPMMILDKIYLIIAVALFVTVGRKYIFALGRFAKLRVANMDTLVGLGTFTAFLYSTLLTLFPTVQEAIHAPEKLYFDVAIIVIGFILLGDYLVARSRVKTGEALQKLMSLQAKSATVIRDGKEI